MGRIVAYYRVSTAEQGRSGLGLDAQRSAVRQLATLRGWQVLEEFTEVQSGKDADRPELAKAIRRARVTGARLAVAKQDRLTRDDLHFFQLRKQGLDWIAADAPDGDDLTAGIKAVMNQEERERISRRTREALAAAKARGVKLGNPNGAAPLLRAGKGNKAAVAIRSDKAERFARERLQDVQEVRQAGAQSLREIAAGLNARGITTPRGGPWHPNSVKRLLERAG
jgi:DNA invertase Pin-like site-specific DNA recombinase